MLLAKCVTICLIFKRITQKWLDRFKQQSKSISLKVWVNVCFLFCAPILIIKMAASIFHYSLDTNFDIFRKTAFQLTAWSKTCSSPAESWRNTSTASTKSLTNSNFISFQWNFFFFLLNSNCGKPLSTAQRSKGEAASLPSFSYHFSCTYSNK